MPRVLRKLRIDEISAVDRAAGEGTRVVLYKRDDDERPGFYQQLLARKRAVRKAKYRDVIPGSRLHRIENLTREEAKHFLLHDRHGRALLRDVGGDIDTLADNLVEASNHVDVEDNNSDEENSVDKSFDAVSFAKRVVNDGVSAVSEQQATELIQK